MSSNVPPASRFSPGRPQAAHFTEIPTLASSGMTPGRGSQADTPGGTPLAPPARVCPPEMSDPGAVLPDTIVESLHSTPASLRAALDAPPPSRVPSR